MFVEAANVSVFLLNSQLIEISPKLLLTVLEILARHNKNCGKKAVLG